MNAQEERKKAGLWRVVGSIMAAAIGVQSNKNREKDFENQTIWPYLIGGLVFTVLFIATLVGVANLYIASV